MKVFLINLDESVDRMGFMQEQLRKLDIEYERLPAVNGMRINNRELRNLVSHFHSLCAMGRRLSRGEIGCALSHNSIYKRMIAEAIPYALILEDDVLIDAGISGVIKEIETHVDVSKPQVYMLSGGEGDGPVSFERIYNSMYTDGYVITAPAAKLVYEANTPIITVADQWRRWVRWDGLELYRCHPAVLKQNRVDLHSTIALSHRTSSNVFVRVFWKSIRLLGLIIDRLICIVK